MQAVAHHNICLLHQGDLPRAGLIQMGSMPGSVRPSTVTRSPPIIVDKSASLVVVAITFNLASCVELVSVAGAQQPAGRMVKLRIAPKTPLIIFGVIAPPSDPHRFDKRLYN